MGSCWLRFGKAHHRIPIWNSMSILSMAIHRSVKGRPSVPFKRVEVPAGLT